MKTRKNRINTQKIIASIMLVVVLFVTIPKPVQADSENGFIEGVLLKPLVQLVASLGDIAMGLLNHFMLGTEEISGSVMLDKSTRNVEKGGSLAVTKDDRKNAVVMEVSKELDGTLLGDWKLPNMLYCPENIFANKIAALDVNFVHPHDYNAIQKSSSSDDSDSNATKPNISIAESLNEIVSSWYRAFRNIAIVGLLSVLIYIGIRILIESTAQGKAKYKERLMDWIVALCLVFVMQYIMSGTLMISERVTQLFDTSGSTRIIVKLTGANDGEELGNTEKTKEFATNLTGYMRFMAQREGLFDCAAYTIIYVALVIFTVKFTFTYLKRVLYMAFFTMISPLVALTYPLDKISDGKAQAFNFWFKEYMMNAVLQPVHLILYTVLVGSAANLAVNNPIYALVAIWFLVPAEKFIKKMFRFDRGETTSGFGDFAAGAVAMSALKKLGSSSSHGAKGSGSSKDGDNKIRTKTPIKEDGIKNLSGFARGTGGGSDDQSDDVTPEYQTADRDSSNQFVDGEPAGQDMQGADGAGRENTAQYMQRVHTLSGRAPTDSDDDDMEEPDTPAGLPLRGQPREQPNVQTLGGWFEDKYGWTPKSLLNDTKSNIRASSAEIKSRLKTAAAGTAHGAALRIENSRIPGLNKIPGMVRNIPAPVKLAAGGVRKISY